jgi:hypothetical protein
MVHRITKQEIERIENLSREELVEDFKKAVSERGSTAAIWMFRKGYYGARLKEFTGFLDKITRPIRQKSGSLSERLYCLEHNITSESQIKRCLICKKIVSFLEYEEGYNDTCGSQSCSAKVRVETEKEMFNGKYRFQTNEFKNKARETNLDRYGVENAFQNEDIKNKQKATLQEKYGVDNISQLDAIQNKKIETSRQKYGTDYPWQTVEGRQKQKDGVMLKYGVDNISKLSVVKYKKEQTSYQNWGVRNPAQDFGIREKILKSTGSIYRTPSSETVLVNSRIEKYVLNKLYNIYNESDIDVQPKIRIPYLDKNIVDRFWFPDIYIKSKNILAEVKHIKTLQLEEDELILKLNASKRNYTPAVFSLYEFTINRIIQYDIFSLIYHADAKHWRFEFLEQYDMTTTEDHKAKIIAICNKYGFQINTI